jgi:nucleotide-binding universal stress UspA family protein
MTQRADRVREVVDGVDGSDEARRAVAWGFREAVLRGVGVRVLTVWTGSPPSGAGEGPRTTEEFERAVVARVRADAVEAVGSRGRSGWAALLLGSVALHCVTAAPCPVAVVRPPRDRGPVPAPGRTAG